MINVTQILIQDESKCSFKQVMQNDKTLAKIEKLATMLTIAEW